MGALRYFFWVTDLGFVAYWLVTLSGILPDEYLFKDYHEPVLVAWNWSFLPLDLLISATGLASLFAHRRAHLLWRPLALLSLALTSCSGLMAISFWVLRRDFDPSWWIPNLYLLVYPLFFLPRLMRGPD